MLCVSLFDAASFPGVYNGIEKISEGKDIEGTLYIASSIFGRYTLSYLSKRMNLENREFIRLREKFFL